MSIPFLLSEKPTVEPVGSAGERSRDTRKTPYGRRSWGSAPRAIVFRHADHEPQFIRCHVVSLIPNDIGAIRVRS